MMLSSRCVVLAALINSEEGLCNNNVGGDRQRSGFKKISKTVYLISQFGVCKMDIDPKNNDPMMMTPLMDAPLVRILRTETN